MMTEAEVILENSTDASDYWKAVGQDVQLFAFSYIVAISGLREIL
jgi:hypothetical protein